MDLSPSTSPTPAVGACPPLSRCVSTASSASASTSASLFDSKLLSAGYSTSADGLCLPQYGRHSLGGVPVSGNEGRSPRARFSLPSRDSLAGRPKRRGYVRPQGTNFAKSAQSRESVLSLGSIAHLQYYFARTGLLDGKGGQLAKKKDRHGTLDFSTFDTSFLTPKGTGADTDSSYASNGASPVLSAQSGESSLGDLLESPTDEDDEDDYYSDEEDEHPVMLPPTTSTYNYREKPLARPPDLAELKIDLRAALADAEKVLREARVQPTTKSSAALSPKNSQSAGGATIPLPPPPSPGSPAGSLQGWYELQGMHILDIITLAIRAAKMYYTAHDRPVRLAAIKSERKIRSELLSVLEVLKRMATRGFMGGMKTDEGEVIENWVSGVQGMLQQEEEQEREERELRSTWLWLKGGWEGHELQRELLFIQSMDPEAETMPEWSPSCDSSELPTLFLEDMRTGLRLVKLHNAIVRKSKRPFGVIPVFHTNTLKPYRCAENLRYWIKAAELRWEVVLKVDVSAVVNGTSSEAWIGFEKAIFQWCTKVREEITAEFVVS